MSADRTCSERIAEHLASREDHLSQLFERQDTQSETYKDDDDAESAHEEVWELALGASIVHTIRVDLSTGGPADYLTAPIERGQYGWELAGEVSYHFADWFDHAEQRVPEGSPLVQYVESIVETWGDES